MIKVRESTIGIRIKIGRKRTLIHYQTLNWSIKTTVQWVHISAIKIIFFMAESMLQVFYRFSSFLNIHIWNRKEECYLKHVQDKLPSLREHWLYTVPKLIDFPQFNMKCSQGNVMLRGIFRAVSGFPLYFMLYRGNFDCISISLV